MTLDLQAELTGELMVAHTRPTLADPLTSFAAAFFGQITLFAGFFKHPKFAEEAEWRLVLRPKPHKLSVAYLKFRPGLRGIVPFLEIPIQEREGEEAVAEVVVGPTPHMAASCSALQTLLSSRGFDNVKIRSSGVPFRDW